MQPQKVKFKSVQINMKHVSYWSLYLSMLLRYGDFIKARILGASTHGSAEAYWSLLGVKKSSNLSALFIHRVEETLEHRQTKTVWLPACLPAYLRAEFPYGLNPLTWCVK